MYSWTYVIDSGLGSMCTGGELSIGSVADNQFTIRESLYAIESSALYVEHRVYKCLTG
jgi:hypothetical protein